MMSLKIVYNTMKNNRLKYFIIILSVTISISSVLLISIISSTSESLIKKQLDTSGFNSMAITLKDSKYGSVLEYSDLMEVKKKVSNIQEISPVQCYKLELESQYRNQEVLSWGMDEDSHHLVGIQLLHGRYFNKSDIKEEKKVILIDKELALESYGRENVVGKSLNLIVEGQKHHFEIIGIIDSSLNIMKSALGDMIFPFAYLPFTTLDTMVTENGFQKIAFTVKDERIIQQSKEEIALLLSKKKKDEVIVRNLTFGKEFIHSIFLLITTVLTVIASVSLVVSGLSIMSCMISAVNERVVEIGIKKAIGATNYHIVLEFILESILICVISFIVSLCGIISILLIIFTLLNIPLIVDMTIICVIFIFSIVMGTAFGAYPAYKASQLNPAQAFRK